MDFVKLAEFADAVEVTEEINNEEIVARESGKHAGPNHGGILAADGFAVFRFEQLESNGLNVGSEVESLNVKRERRELEGAGIERRFAWCAHTSDSA